MSGNMPAAGHSPVAGSAAGDLEKVRLFVNTRDLELGTDELSTPDALARWLGEHGLLTGQAGAGQPGQAFSATGQRASDFRQAIALREALRGVLLSHVSAAHPAASGHPGGADPAAELRRIAAALPAGLAVTENGDVRAAPAGTGVPAALAAILLIAAEAAVAGTWSRLKVCSAGDCRWAFYDRSPTRNGCWCSMAVCGARSKSRAYRKRVASRAPVSEPAGSPAGGTAAGRADP